jgi:hypothetical protein
MVGAVSQLSVAVAVPVLSGSVLAVHSIVNDAGQVMTGAWLSSTVIVCVHELLLPQASVALHVLVMIYSCGHPPPTVTSDDVMVGAVSQLSVAVAVPVFAGNVLAVHSIVREAGQVMTGAILSSTVIVCVHELLLPQSSVAAHVLVMIYSCGHPPPTVTSEDVIVGAVSHRSVAVAVPVFAGNVLAVHSIVNDAGQVINGACVSSTVMVCVHELLLPQSSVALHVLVMIYS